jgi:hypothetical protein
MPRDTKEKDPGTDQIKIPEAPPEQPPQLTEEQKEGLLDLFPEPGPESDGSRDTLKNRD